MNTSNQDRNSNESITIPSEDTAKLNNSSPDIRIEGQPRKNGTRGAMSGNVGTGKYAKTNIIWYIVSATFVVFSCITAAFIVMSIYGYEIKDTSQSIKDIWGIFTPILTLALGYLFGKQGSVQKKNRKKQRK